MHVTNQIIRHLATLRAQGLKTGIPSSIPRSFPREVDYILSRQIALVTYFYLAVKLHAQTPTGACSTQLQIIYYTRLAPSLFYALLLSSRLLPQCALYLSASYSSIGFRNFPQFKNVASAERVTAPALTRAYLLRLCYNSYKVKLQLLLLFIYAQLNLFTLIFRALDRNYIILTLFSSYYNTIF